MRRKLELLSKLDTKWAGCELCDLARSRRRIVHWRGAPGAPLAIIGEAPGESEDEQGLPFVGASGRLLDEMLRDAGLDAGEQTFIVNMVGCRPPGNRTPEREEVKACSPRLDRLLEIAAPKALLLMGSVAAKLAGVGSVTGHRGLITYVDLLGTDDRLRQWPAVITYHPAYVLREYLRRGSVVNDINLVKTLAF